jgi:hypothetical protein
MAKKLPYFVLVERLSATSPWGVAFGAIYRADVESERDDRRDHGVAASNLKILATGHLQADIDAAVAALNPAPAADPAPDAARYVAVVNTRNCGQTVMHDATRQYAVVVCAGDGRITEVLSRHVSYRGACVAAARRAKASQREVRADV